MKTNKNLIAYEPLITTADRTRQKGHQPAVVWFTGLSGSGKSTIANLVEEQLANRFNSHTYILDGDAVRAGLNADLGFSLADRSENIRRVGEVCKLMADAGLIVLTAFISPLRVDRDNCRKMIANSRFIEVFVDCPLAACEVRDPKGLYTKARAGEIPDFTGVSSPYEVPQKPEIHLHTDRMDAPMCARQVIQYLVDEGIIKNG